MIHAALWIISTLFVIWFSVVCGALVLAFIVAAWRWILGVVVLIGALILVNTNTKEIDRKASPLTTVSNPTVEAPKTTSSEIVAPAVAPKLYAPLAASVLAGLPATIADRPAPEPQFPSVQDKVYWLTEMSARLEHRLSDRQAGLAIDAEARLDFLKTVHYEAKRAGLDPQLILALIDNASGFQKFEVSPSGARGYMQVMPRWVKLIGTKESNLFHLRTNLRFGCVILRHYLDIESGDLYRALGRYHNDMIGKEASVLSDKDIEFTEMVRSVWESRWSWGPQKVGPN